MRPLTAAAVAAVCVALCVAAVLVSSGNAPDAPDRATAAADPDVPEYRRRVRTRSGATATDTTPGAEDVAAATGVADAAADPAAAPVWTPATRSWGGVVEDLRGQPIAGARVASGECSVLTDSDGSFLLPGLKPRRADLVVTAPGFARRKLDGWPGRHDLRIVLPREVRATGVVVHLDGRPAEGAKVDHVCTTGADGRFDVPLEEGRESVFAMWGVLPGTRDDVAAYGRTWLTVDPDRPPKDVRVVLDDLSSWVGVAVTRPDGRPADGATVWYVIGDEKIARGTDASGASSWTLSTPPGTEMELRVDPRNGTGRGRVVVRTRTLPGAGERVRVTLADESPADEPPPALPPPVEFPVRVVDEAGNDVRDARFYDVAVDGRGVARARPDADGRVRVRVQAPGFVERRFPVSVVPSPPAEARLVLVRCGHIAVSVLDPDHRSRTLLLRVGYALTEVADGRSDIATWDIDPGETRVRLYSDDDDVPEWWRTVQVVPGGTTQVVCEEVRAVPVRGRVVDRDGRPLGGVGIQLRAGPWFGGRFDGGDACTAPDGRFELGPIDADVVHVAAVRDDLATAWTRFEPREGAVAELRMSPGGTIVFQLAPGDFVDADAAVVGVDGAPRIWLDVGFDDSRRSVITRVPPGRWRLKCKVSHAERETDVDVRESETTVVDLR